MVAIVINFTVCVKYIYSSCLLHVYQLLFLCFIMIKLINFTNNNHIAVNIYNIIIIISIPL